MLSITSRVYRRRTQVTAGLSGLAIMAALLGGCQGGGAGRPGGGGEGTLTLTIAVTPSEAGGVSLSPDRERYSAGEQVTLTPQPADGWRFDRWQGDADGTDNPLVLTVNSDLAIEAVFVSSDSDPGEDITIADETQVLPDTVLLTLDDEGGAVLAGDGLPETLEPGALLVSKQDGGHLLRVITVQRDGATYVLTTQQAALTDLIKTGAFTLTIPFDAEHSTVEYIDPAAARLIAAKGLHAAQSGANLSIQGFSIELDEVGKVTLDDLTFTFAPDFDVRVDIDGGSLREFRCVADSQFTINLDATVEATQIVDLLKKEVTVYSLKWPSPIPGVITLGGVPVVYQCFLDVKLGAQVNFGDTGTISAGFDYTTWASVGAGYDQTNGWYPVADAGQDFNPHPPEWSLTPVQAQVYVQPEFGIKFFGVVGPSLSWKEYLQLVGDYRYETLGAEILEGSEVDANLKFEVIDGLPSFKFAQRLWDREKLLVARLAFASGPEGLGTLSVSDSGLGAGFYWFSSPVTVTASPEAGYESVGWLVRGLCREYERTDVANPLTEPVDLSKRIETGFVPEGFGGSWPGAGGSGTQTWTLTTEVFPPGAGTIACFPQQALYAPGTNVLVFAEATPGFVFHHWELDLSGSEPTQTVPMNGNRSIRAVFASDPPRILRVPDPYPTIQAALAAATYNDIIEVADGDYSGDGFQDLAISRDHVTIRGEAGAAVTIDLLNAARLADLHGVAGMVFENLTIRNGQAPSGRYGGALTIWNDADVTVRDCVFSKNRASHGGAIGIYSTPQRVLIEDCRFDENVGTSYGGAVSIEGTSADPEDELTQLTGCTFTANTAAYDGGALYATRACVLTDCTFTGNSSNEAGAVDLSAAGTRLTRCAFTGNTADSGSAGAVDAGAGTTLDHCEFSYNTAANSGGAIRAGEDTEILYCTLADNTSSGATTHGGGGIRASHARIFGCTITGNTAAFDGGGIRCDNTEVGDTTVTNNTAGASGGGIYALWSQVSGCTVTGNTASGAQPEGGGGIYTTHSTIQSTTVQDNTAPNGYGGGICALQDTMIAGCVRTSPDAVSRLDGISNNSALWGGGVWCKDGVILCGSDLLGNQAANQGGGVYAERNSTVSICWIESNTAEHGGGASLNESAAWGTTLRGNTATGEGGGLALFESNATRCTAEANTAALDGGGIWTGVGCAITDCWVFQNSVTPGTGGGGVACHGNPAFSGNQVYGNTPVDCVECTGCP